MTPYVFIMMFLCWSGLLWTLATMLCRMGPSPKVAQAVWRMAAAMMFAPLLAAQFMPSLATFQPAQISDLHFTEPFMEGLVVAGVETVIPPETKLDIGMCLLGLIMAGWAVRLTLWGMGQFRLQRLKKRASLWDRPIGHWADALGLRRVPQIRVTQKGSPFLAGIVRPVVFVPAALIRRENVVQVIVHEMVHLKRGDLLTRPIERIVADLFWFSPFAWAIRERLDYWREAVVDAEAVDLTGDRIAYARALTSAARYAHGQSLLPVAAFNLSKEGNLKMRLEHLLSEPGKTPRRFGIAIVAAACLAVPVALAQGALITGDTSVASHPGFAHAVLDKARLTSRFGDRIHPITNKPAHHDGVDLAEAEGSPVYAPAGGAITFSGEKGAYGNLVVLQLDDGMSMRFAQLAEISVGVGDTVKAGEILGTVGQSGRATGPHLHLEVWDGESRIDPESVDGLVLAGELKEMAPVAPTAPVAPDASAAPIAPETHGIVVDEVAPEAPVAPEVPDASEAPLPPEAPHSH